MKIYYKTGYKYQLHKDVIVDVGRLDWRLLGHHVSSQYFEMLLNGLLLIRAGYAWDGCSGPTWDDKSNMRAGLVHDALYQMLREGLIPTFEGGSREAADNVFHKILLEDGMSKFRAGYYYQAVRAFGKKAASRRGRRKVHVAGAR